MPTLYIDTTDAAQAQGLLVSQQALALGQPSGCDVCGTPAVSVSYTLAPGSSAIYSSMVTFECGNAASVSHSGTLVVASNGVSCSNVHAMVGMAYAKATVSYRYVKFDFTTTGAVRCQELNVHTVAGQDLPPAQASGSTLVDSGYFYAGYDGWKAFDDSISTDWWTLANPTASQSWVAVDLGAVESIQYFEVLMSPLSYNLASSVKIYCANLPDFSDQVLVVDKATDTVKNNIYVVGGPTP